MNTKIVFIALLVIAAPMSLKTQAVYAGEEQETKAVYTCPMHPEYISDKPGACPSCGMYLVKKTEVKGAEAAVSEERKALYYRNPMDPSVTSPVPMKDSMGMDYIPVYEEAPEEYSHDAQ